MGGKVVARSDVIVALSGIAEVICITGIATV